MIRKEVTVIGKYHVIHFLFSVICCTSLNLTPSEIFSFFLQLSEYAFHHQVVNRRTLPLLDRFLKRYVGDPRLLEANVILAPICSLMLQLRSELCSSPSSPSSDSAVKHCQTLVSHPETNDETEFRTPFSCCRCHEPAWRFPSHFYLLGNQRCGCSPNSCLFSPILSIPFRTEWETSTIPFGQDTLHANSSCLSFKLFIFFFLVNKTMISFIQLSSQCPLYFWPKHLNSKAFLIFCRISAKMSSIPTAFHSKRRFCFA